MFFEWGLSLYSSRENSPGTRVHGSRDQARWVKGDPRFFGSSVRKRKAPRIGKRFSGTSSRAGSKGRGSSSPISFPGWRRRSRGSFSKRREPLCPLCLAGCAEQEAEEEPKSAGLGPQADL